MMEKVKRFIFASQAERDQAVAAFQVPPLLLPSLLTLHPFFSPYILGSDSRYVSVFRDALIQLRELSFLVPIGVF